MRNVFFGVLVAGIATYLVVRKFNEELQEKKDRENIHFQLF